MGSVYYDESVISRKAGRSAVRAAAYRHGAVMRATTRWSESERGRTWDYTAKADEIAWSELALPEGAPPWMEEAFGAAAFEAALADAGGGEAAGEGGQAPSGFKEERAAWATLSERLWNAVERHELHNNAKRAIAQLARSVIVSLPVELSRGAQIGLMRDFVRDAYASRGMVADWVIHDTGPVNPHAHVLLTTRRAGEAAWGNKVNEWGGPGWIYRSRERWAAHANVALEREGRAERVFHRRLRDYGIKLEPEAYERRGGRLDDPGFQVDERRRFERVRERNQAYLRAHPEHVIAVVQAGRASFTKGDLLDELARRLDLAPGTLPEDLVQAVVRSEDLVPLAAAGDGRRRYVSRARAAEAALLGRDAAALAGGRLERAPEPADPFEAGEGAILVDVAEAAAEERGERPPARDPGRPERPAGAREPRAGTARRGFDAKAVRRALGERAEDLFRAAFGEPATPASHEWRPRGADALAMEMRGPRRGLWRDHAADEGGDLLDLVARTFLGLERARDDFPAVLREAARFAGLSEAEAVRQAAPEARAREGEEEARRAARARREEAREALRRRDLVAAIEQRARPVDGTPAEAYLKSRGIPRAPLGTVAYLPHARGLKVHRPGAGALVVWARSAAGGIVGGQRILLDGEGRPLDADVRKPAFGALSGAAARFPARRGREDGPLVVAEGPETALAIWTAAGFETWAVFGASNWRNAPLPEGREIVLAPDRDAPDSPAGRAFRKAAARHLLRGRDLRVALAPEPSGSKADLGDTLRRRSGGRAVRKAIEAARPLVADLDPRLDPGQRAAAEEMLGPSRLTLVQGAAGAGKTAALREAARIWAARGVEVLAGAPSARATQELSRVEGARAATLAAWESRWARGEGVPEGPFVFVMDEAGMVGAGAWARIQSRILAAGGKLVAVGDPEQLQPVTDLPGWDLAAVSAGRVATMGRVLRQEDPAEREAVASLARGESGLREGLERFRRRGALRFDGKTLDDPVAAIAAAWRTDGEPGLSRVALAHSNEDVAALNAAIRAAAAASGGIDDAASVEVAVERVRRKSVDGLARTVREPAAIRLAPGDRVTLSRPLPAHDLARSAFGTVASADPDRIGLRVDGREGVVEIGPEEFSALDHGYAATVHKAQGMTVDVAFVLAHRRMDRHGLYVALSRHRRRVALFGRRGHVETPEALLKAGRRRDALRPLRDVSGEGTLAPFPEEAAVRADWRGPARPQAVGTLAGDGRLMSVALRTAGLMAAGAVGADPALREDSSDSLAAGPPEEVVAALAHRHGVFRAEEAAALLSRQTEDPETFLRLFAEAMSSAGLVALPGGSAGADPAAGGAGPADSGARRGARAPNEGAGRGADAAARVYTTRAHLAAETAAVDLGMRLAARRGEAAAARREPGPGLPPARLAALSGGQRAALAHALADGGAGLRIVEGGSVSGKTRLAAAIVEAHAAAGRRATALSPTAAGRAALEAEGAEALTLGEFLDSPAPPPGGPPRVAVLDDAHTLAAVRGGALLERLGRDGADLVALANPDRRPWGAGAVFRALAARVETARIAGAFGLDPEMEALARGLAGGAGPAREALAALAERGAVRADGDREAAVAAVARAWLEDPSEDKVALGWSQADAAALAGAIRDARAEDDPMAAGHEVREGPLAGVRPGDLVRLTAPGRAGGVRLRRGDVLEARAPGSAGGMVMRLAGRDGAAEFEARPGEPFPPWRHAVAATVGAAAGERRESVHLLAFPGMDRHAFAAGALAARSRLAVSMPCPREELDRALAAVAGRVRPPRTVFDHGFDPAAAGRAAALSAPAAPARDEVPEALARPAVPRPDVSISRVRGARANREWLAAHPEHALALAQVRRPAFTERDVRRALLEAFGASLMPSELKALGDRAMASGHLRALAEPAPDGSVRYVTEGRAALLRRAAREAGELASGRFGARAMLPAELRALEGLDASQAAAVRAMLGDDRLTLVQGRAGSGKTHALRAAARAWKERGVPVLAGAPSGRATRELAGIDGMRALTLAAWESRWARRGGLPEAPYVFVIDEAGMVGAAQWARLQSRVLATGGKLVAVGDPDQLQPVSDLPGWSIAERAAGPGRTAVIGSVRRQRDPLDAQATEALARGGANVPDAVAHYAESGALLLGAHVRADPVAAAARAWLADVARDPAGARSRVALGYSNRDVAALNEAIREGEVARGAVTGTRDYGTIERVERDAHGRESRLRVPLRLGAGDRVTLTRPHPGLDMPRSSFGTVVEAREDGIEVRFDGSDRLGRIELPGFPHVDYGYAATVHKAQGLTADAVFVVPHRRMHRHAVYVALSRHRDTLRVFGRAGHLERVADLVRMGQAAGSLDMDPAADFPDAEAPAMPGAGAVGLSGRADWLAGAAGAGRVPFLADAELAAVAERHAGLMEASARDGEGAPPGDPKGYLREPGKAVDDLVRRGSVFRAEDAASRLARAAPDADAFLRMFREAMSRPDVVLLSAGDGRGARVYTTRGQLALELDAADAGARLALSLPPDAAPKRPLAQARALLESDLDPNQRAAAVAAAAPGRLRLVDGAPGSGRDAAVRIVAELHAEAGWSVIGAAPTGAGLDGLRGAGLGPRGVAGGGVGRLRTLRSLLAALDGGRARLDPGTVVLLDDAGRVGAREALDLFERVDAAGARLVAFMDDGSLAPSGAGPVFRALRVRIGAARLNWAYAGTPRRTMAMGWLLRGGGNAARALDMLAEDGVFVAGQSAAGAARKAAEGWMLDGAWDKVALAWSRDEAAAVTREIRRELDRRVVERHVDGEVPDGPFRGLAPGDRVRVVARRGPWPDDLPAAARLVPGERAEFLGLSADGAAVFDAMDLDGAMRRASVPPGAAPDWRFDFAGTVHGECGRTFESVHLVAGRGMGRQVLAAGARAHRGRLRIVVPAPEDGMRAALDDIASRDAAPESVLDHGFEPAFAAREAMRARAAEAPGKPAGLGAAAARLLRIAGLGGPAPSMAAPRGLEGAALAEAIGAAILRHGEAPAGADRLALESHAAALTNPASWRRILRQAPAGLPARADALAREVAGVVPGREPGEGEIVPMTARILARGALSARALGEEGLAGMYEDGLRLFGQRAATARMHGRPEELAAPAAAGAREYPDVIPSGREARGRGEARRPARFRSLAPYPLPGGAAGEEQLVREVLGMFGIRAPRLRWRRYWKDRRRAGEFAGRAALAREAAERARREAARAERQAAREARLAREAWLARGTDAARDALERAGAPVPGSPAPGSPAPATPVPGASLPAPALPAPGVPAGKPGAPAREPAVPESAGRGTGNPADAPAAEPPAPEPAAREAGAPAAASLADPAAREGGSPAREGEPPARDAAGGRAAARAAAPSRRADIPGPARPEPGAPLPEPGAPSRAPLAADASPAEPSSSQPAGREPDAPSWDGMLGGEPQNWDALPGNPPFPAPPGPEAPVPAREPSAREPARREDGAARPPAGAGEPGAPVPAIPDAALEIAVAVSARVEDGHEAHALDLPGELARLLARAASAPEDAGARAFAERIANRRAAADAKLALAEAVIAREQESWDRHRGEDTPQGRAWATRKRPTLNRAAFAEVEPKWDPKAPGADPAIHHPLFAHRPAARAAYDAHVDRAVAQAWEYGAEPSGAELAAARIARLEDAPAGLVEAMARALSRGAATGAAELRAEREAVLGELARVGEAGLGREEAEDAQKLVERLYGAFTRGEVEALARNRGGDVRSLPARAGGEGEGIARGIEAVAACAPGMRLGYHPWAGHAKGLGDAPGGRPERSRTRGVGMSM